MIRYLVDENMRGVGKALVEVRTDITYVGDPGNTRKNRSACPIELSMADEDWLPEVGARDWVVITRDKRIRSRPAEIQAVRAHSIRMFTLTSRMALSSWDQLALLVRQWDRIEEEVTQPGPFIYSVTSGGVRRLPI